MTPASQTVSTGVAHGRGRLTVALLVLGGIAGLVLAAPTWFALLWFVPYASVGSLLVLRRRGGAIGWLMLALAWFHVLASLPYPFDADALQAGTAPAMDQALAVLVGGATGITLFLLYVMLVMVFPSGQLPGGGMGRLTRLTIGLGSVLVLLSVFAPTLNLSWAGHDDVTVANPWAFHPESPLWEPVTSGTAFSLVIVALVAAAASLTVRFRRATGVERQQLRWMVLAILAVVLAVLGGFLAGALIPGIAGTGLEWLPAIFAFPLVPISIGIAVLRYRLYDIDRVVSRTIAWAVVTLLLAAVFVAAIVLLQALVVPFTGNSTISVAASTLLVAALFQPLRRRVQRRIDHRFNRARYHAEHTAAEFALAIRDEVDLARIHDGLLRSVEGALHPASTRLWLRTRTEAPR